MQLQFFAEKEKVDGRLRPSERNSRWVPAIDGVVGSYGILSPLQNAHDAP